MQARIMRLWARHAGLTRTSFLCLSVAAFSYPTTVMAQSSGTAAQKPLSAIDWLTDSIDAPRPAPQVAPDVLPLMPHALMQQAC